MTPTHIEHATRHIDAILEKKDQEQANEITELTLDMLWLTGETAEGLMLQSEKMDRFKKLVSATHQYRASIRRALKATTPIRTGRPDDWKGNTGKTFLDHEIEHSRPVRRGHTRDIRCGYCDGPVGHDGQCKKCRIIQPEE